MAEELTAYLNGEFLPISECKVSISDRGFGGDSVYDVERAAVVIIALVEVPG